MVTSQKKLKLAGADKVIMPDKIGGDHMASLVVMPDLITFMDKLSMEGEHTTNLEEVAIEEPFNKEKTSHKDTSDSDDKSDKKTFHKKKFRKKKFFKKRTGSRSTKTKEKVVVKKDSA